MWRQAIACAIPALGLSPAPGDIETALALTLGEARFGPDHWRLSPIQQMYYLIKPLLPRALTRLMRRLYSHPPKHNGTTTWPVDLHYVNFLWEIMKHLVQMTPGHQLCIRSFWPQGFHYSLVLTHDIESSAGQGFVRAVADLEESLGFRSSFNFVPEGYKVDLNLMDELRQRSFEVGIHGLTHDGKLFNSRRKFESRAIEINRYLKEFDGVGFRSPLMHRNPEWMQSLDVEYDLSFFDTDPFEPIPGGTMSIWPFQLGHFIELPYTLVQDYTLTAVLKETTPRLWLEKVDFIEKYYGMALVNSHPDYLRNPTTWKVYSEFLSAMARRSGYWQALPREVAAWWRERCSEGMPASSEELLIVRLVGDELEIGRAWKQNNSVLAETTS
jgi:hypothetical protein